MDDGRFDAFAKLLVRGISRRAAGLSAVALLVTGIPNAGGMEAKKKKKKRCRKLRQACSSAKNKKCCKGLSCSENPFFNCDQGHDYCCGKSGTTCEGLCDCCGDLQCSERSKTCEHCAQLGESCASADNCCFLESICSTNGCATGNFCCQGEGNVCFDDCHCCGNLTCNEGSLGIGICQ